MRDKAFPKYIAFSFSLTFAAPQKCISYLLLFPALANVLENTALFGDILLRLPDITYKVRSYHQHSVEGRKRDSWLSSKLLCYTWISQKDKVKWDLKFFLWNLWCVKYWLKYTRCTKFSKNRIRITPPLPLLL